MHFFLHFVTIMIVCHGLWIVCKCQEQRARYDKYILLWNEPNSVPSSLFMSRRHAFKAYNCSNKNCYVTHNKDFFHGSMIKFDAIVFNGISLPKKLEINRYPHQKYIYANMNPATEYPICHPSYDGFFNWTATYKLDSDFIFPFLVVKNASGHAIGPRKDMEWIKDMVEIEEKFTKTMSTKRKAAAWFVSKCAHTDRNEYVYQLQQELGKYNLSIDIYGRCGELRCPKSKLSECLTMLRKDYFFYLALESANAPDYVTEKVVPALQNYVVPVVRGGADYSRFLPPNSYLDAKSLTPKELALKMKEAINSLKIYQQFFKWRRYYRFTTTSPQSAISFKGDGVCKICEALHKEDEVPTETCVGDIRNWWNPNSLHLCRKNGNTEEAKLLLKTSFDIKMT